MTIFLDTQMSKQKRVESETSQEFPKIKSETSQEFPKITHQTETMTDLLFCPTMTKHNLSCHEMHCQKYQHLFGRLQKTEFYKNLEGKTMSTSVAENRCRPGYLDHINRKL